VPGLGDLPIVGRLFGSRQDTSDKTEIVLSITPHLVRNIQRPAANVAEFSAGTESSFRRRPDGAACPAAQLPAPAGAVRPQLAQPAPRAVPGTVPQRIRKAWRRPPAAGRDGAGHQRQRRRSAAVRATSVPATRHPPPRADRALKPQP
jgi:general secretion pathway protein D